MARPARVVEHLRLRGESESAVRHALPALEDAFRTASLPDAGARLICVRRLQLGRLAANASAQSVSLLVEKRFQNFDLAGAYAASALLALISLATLLAMTVLKPRKDRG